MTHHHSTARLGSRPQALITAVADAFFPPAGPIPLSGSDAGILGYLERYLSRTEPLQRTMIRQIGRAHV